MYKWKLWLKGGVSGKVKGSLQTVGFIWWGQNLAMLRVVEIFCPGPKTYCTAPRSPPLGTTNSRAKTEK